MRAALFAVGCMPLLDLCALSQLSIPTLPPLPPLPFNILAYLCGIGFNTASLNAALQPDVIPMTNPHTNPPITPNARPIIVQTKIQTDSSGFSLSRDVRPQAAAPTTPPLTQAIASNQPVIESRYDYPAERHIRVSFSHTSTKGLTPGITRRAIQRIKPPTLAHDSNAIRGRVHAVVRPLRSRSTFHADSFLPASTSLQLSSLPLLPWCQYSLA